MNCSFLTTSVYPFPNDEQELDRLDMQHHIWKQINDSKLYFAPLQDPKRILDIGTGSGIWPIEMGKHTFSSPLTSPLDGNSILT